MQSYSRFSAVAWRLIGTTIALCASVLVGAAPGYALVIGPSIVRYTITYDFDSGLGPTDQKIYADPHADTNLVKHLDYGKTLNGSGDAHSTANGGITLFANSGCLCLAFDVGTGVLQDADNQTDNISTASLIIRFDILYGIGDVQLGGPLFYGSSVRLIGDIGAGAGDFASFDDGFTVTHNGIPQDPLGLDDAQCGGANAFFSNIPGPYTAHPRCLVPVVSPNFYSAGEGVEINGFLVFNSNNIGADPTSIYLATTSFLSPTTNVPEPGSVILATTSLIIFGGFGGWTWLRRKNTAFSLYSKMLSVSSGYLG